MGLPCVYYPAHMLLRSRVVGGHIRTDVFVGPDVEHRRLVGTLAFAIEDFSAWRAFFSALYVADGRTGLATVELDHDEVIDHDWS